MHPISIHALRVEGDVKQSQCQRISACYFYPRPPGGGRQQFDYPVYIDLEISIHALRVEGDLRLCSLKVLC